MDQVFKDFDLHELHKIVFTVMPQFGFPQLVNLMQILISVMILLLRS